VPPPPAPGAPVRLGVGLAAELGVGVCVAVLVEVAPDEDEGGEELGLPLAAVPVAAAWLVEPVKVGAGMLPRGVVEDDVQPAKAAEATMAKTPRRMTVSFALSTEPAITRTVM
jgi:hypothetical protein